MSQYVGHESCYEVLDKILEAFERGGYKRLVVYGTAGESVLMDSKPAPGYTPGILGKRATGIAYVPAADGTRIHVYYMAGHKADADQIARASLATKAGFDPREILGTIISISRCKNGNIQLQFVAANRVVKDEDGHITEELAIDSVSVSNEPSHGGTLIAMALDQSLGIPYHQLKAMASSEEATKAITVAGHLRAAQAARGIPDGIAGAELEPRNTGVAKQVPVQEE
jgi:hypothetical protein